MKAMIYQVKLSQYIREQATIYVEANSVDDAALAAIEAINWISPEWKKDKGAHPKSGTPIVIGPVFDDLHEELVYNRKK